MHLERIQSAWTIWFRRAKWLRSHARTTKRARAVVELDFVQQDDSSGSIYTARVSVGGCEDCGYIELYGLIHTSY